MGNSNSHALSIDRLSKDQALFSLYKAVEDSVIKAHCCGTVNWSIILSWCPWSHLLLEGITWWFLWGCQCEISDIFIARKNCPPQKYFWWNLRAILVNCNYQYVGLWFPPPLFFGNWSLWVDSNEQMHVWCSFLMQLSQLKENTCQNLPSCRKLASCRKE